MPDYQTQLHALNTLGMIGIVCAVLICVFIALLGFAPAKRESKVVLVGAFGLWIGLVACLTWFTLDPAIRAIKLVNNPAMFAIIGLIAGVILFSLRRVRKDIYGLLEIGVAIATLLALGRKYDSQSEITIIIGFVGAIYVVVRGLTNISEQWAK